MTENEKTEYAKQFIDKLSQGINPLDNQHLADNDIVKNERIVRCLYYVSDILGQVVVNGGVSARKKNGTDPFSVDRDDLDYFKYSSNPIAVSEFAKRINELVDDENMKKLTHSNITDWLISAGILVEETSPSGKKQKSPTEQGKALGISTEFRSSPRGTYRVVLYDKSAQRFLVDNMESILAFIAKNKNTDVSE